MYSSFLEDFIINQSESIYKAAYLMQKTGTDLIVVDDNNLFVGLIGRNEINESFFVEKNFCYEICNKQCKRVIADNQTDVLPMVRNIFAEHNFRFLPVIDAGRNILDFYSRERAFFLDSYNGRKLKKMHYAEMIMDAAVEANALGIDKFSVIEFGVAGGNGLVCAESYAEQIERLKGISQIEVYGFDNAKGLPEIKDKNKEATWMWATGMFNVLDIEKTRKRLRRAKLVVGEIEETLASFEKVYNPAPIGAIFVDTDLYISAKTILNELKEIDHGLFMPRTIIYFDDLDCKLDSIGEDLAVKEFNRENDDIKILPEGSNVKIKTMFRYNHPLYHKHNAGGWKFRGCDYYAYTI